MRFVGSGFDHCCVDLACFVTEIDLNVAFYCHVPKVGTLHHLIKVWLPLLRLVFLLSFESKIDGSATPRNLAETCVEHFFRNLVDL